MIFVDRTLYPKGELLSPVLDENTWEQISNASAEGTGKNYWSVGDCKKIHVEGVIGRSKDPDYPVWDGTGSNLEINQDFFVFIIGFDHNSALEGNGIVFQCFKSSLGNGINVKNDVALIDSLYNSDSDIGAWFTIFHPNANQYLRKKPGLGWKYSDIRYDILGSTDIRMDDATPNTPINPVPDTLMSALPLDLRSVMKPMTIYSNTRPEADTSLPLVSASIDYLPLLSEYEACGDYRNPEEIEYQKVYEYYQAIDDREEINGITDPIKFAHNDLSTAVTWLTRTGINNSSYWVCMRADDDNESGSFSGDFVNRSYGISPVFKV